MMLPCIGLHGGMASKGTKGRAGCIRETTLKMMNGTCKNVNPNR